MSVGKGPSPLVGFNNNVKHKGRIFHVQTEDSGVSRPHIVTHLFADGGRILKSTRTDYSEHLGRVDMANVVRSLMKEQHKAMFIALRDGQLDATIDGLLGPVLEQPPAPSVTARSLGPAASSTPTGKIPDLSAGIPSFPPSSKEAAAAPVAAPKDAPPPTLTDLVLADLENARAVGKPSALPKPPPKPGKSITPALGTPSAPPRAPAAASRYSAARPAAIFTTSPDQQRSIFGGASISEQSLDEVILSYLAEDLEGTPDK